MSLTLPSRRNLMVGAGLGGLLAGFGRRAMADPVFADYPFQLGVAAGDPAQDGFVIWTRLAPKPLEIGYGMPSAPVPVKWEVASDEGFRTIVRSGEAVARPELGHAVHVEVEGLEPGRQYFYRFNAGRERSNMGKAKTAPALGASLARSRFGVGGCQHYEQGFFTAWRRLADEDLDFVFHYGDYIYEGRGARVFNSSAGPQENPRQHFGGEVYSLDDYRRRYAQYRMDTDLQDAHASTAWYMTWDDHEIDNNWVSDIDQDGSQPDIFALRKQAAVQAYYEHMPFRRSAFPKGSGMQLYRGQTWGDLLDLNFLDTRQFRTDQPCEDRFATTCAGVDDAAAQVLGQAQEAWLFDNLNRSRARWKVLAQQVMVMDLDRKDGEEIGYNLDSWAGYRIPRQRLLRHIRDRRIANTVVLTGDEHQNYAGELYLDGRNPDGAPVAAEFVTTSISSSGDGVDQRPDMARIQAANPQLKFNNAQRGFAVCDVTAETWRTEFKVLNKVSTRDAQLTTRKVMALEAGSSRLQEA